MGFSVFSGALFILLFLLLVLAFWGRIKFLFFDPFVLFFAVFIFSCFAVPAYARFYGYSRYDAYYSDYSYYLVSLYCLIFLLCLSVLYWVFGGRHNVCRVSEFKFLDFGRFYVVGFVLLVMCLLAFYQFVKLIGVYGLGAFLANRIVLTAGLGYYKLALFFPVLWVVVYSVEKFFVRKREFAWKRYFLGCVLVVFASAPLLVLGSRSNLLVGLIFYSFSVLLVCLKLGWINVYRKLLAKFSLLLFCIVLLGGALGGLRQSMMSGDNESRTISYVQSEVPLESVISAFSSYENLAWIFENGSVLDYQLGSTYFSVLLGPVPRSFWPAKPTGAGPIMKNIIAPGTYDLIGGEKISSYTTGAPSEAYLNFGWAGALIGGGVFAAVLVLVKLILSRSASSLGVVVSVVLLFRTAGFVNAEFYGVFIQFFLVAIFYFICLSCYRKRVCS